MGNLLFGYDSAVKRKSGDPSVGIAGYAQENCSVGLADAGYRIYRAPNKTISSDGYTMGGGCMLRNNSVGGLHEYNAATDNIGGFQKGHSYILMFHIEGQSSNAPEFYGTNQCGGGGGGLDPSPTTISYSAPSSNFNGSWDFHYAGTITDNVVKTCTYSYSYATEGKDYLSYMDFKYGFGYTDTGSLGTDLYLTNFRMYDITDIVPTAFSKNGNIISTDFIEQNGVSILRGVEVKATEIIEN